ncbi:MAG: TIGR02147 family protein [Chitinivibrionales bacterium]|nr:TIGR02147 family protein [Chitinivibrionales bacterium]
MAAVEQGYGFHCRTGSGPIDRSGGNERWRMMVQLQLHDEGEHMRPIGEYHDYREYLRDFYHFKKRTNPYYSYRLFSMKAGFKAPNLLKLVMDGKRNLTRQSVVKFAKALRLDELETERFRAMVLRNQGGFPVRRGVPAEERVDAELVPEPELAIA